MVREIRALVRYRELLYMLSLRDIKLRYKQSVMGLLWAMLMPGLIVAAGIVVRLLLSGGRVDRAALAGIVVRSLPWAFFVASLRFATNSLIGNANLVSKVAFPKEVFPLAAVAASLFDLGVACLAGALALLLLGVRVDVAALWAVPLLLTLVAFTCGACLLLASLNLFYRDVKYIVEVLLTFAIFFTPVLYDASMLGRFETLALLNPVAPILEGLDGAIVAGTPPDPAWLGYSVAWAVLLLWVGYATFKHLEYRFAESV